MPQAFTSTWLPHRQAHCLYLCIRAAAEGAASSITSIILLIGCRGHLTFTPPGCNWSPPASGACTSTGCSRIIYVAGFCQPLWEAVVEASFATRTG